MNIALDYDGTYTNDPGLWLHFIANALTRGHDVRVVTMRYPSEVRCGDDPMDVRLLEQPFRLQIIATSRKAKHEFCQAIGWEPHIWIDDNPKAVYMDASQVWPHNPPAPEGHPVVPVYK